MIELLRSLRQSRLLLPTVLLLLGGISYGSLFTANKIAIDAGFPFVAYSFWQALFAGVFCSRCLRSSPSRPRSGGRTCGSSRWLRSSAFSGRCWW